jgi:DHA2 family methylenomycin A resistance protein-like MFS transporter
MFMVMLDVSVVNTALPSIQRQLHTSLSGLQWVVDAYTLAFAVLLLTTGAVADRHGRRRVFRIGLFVFSLGSLLCGLSVTAGELDAARALQGLGGAALAPSSLALLATAFPDPVARVRAVSLWAAISGLALGVGPTVGGALVDSAGWRWVFFINVPIGLAVALVGVRRLRESRDPAGRRLDARGQVTSVAWLGALTYGFIEIGSHGFFSPQVWAPLAAAALLVCLFLSVERRSSDPMLPLGLFSSRLFSATALTTFLIGFVLISVPFFTVQYFQEVQHLSAFASGLRVLAFTLMFSLIAPLAGRLAARYGFRVPVAVGALIAAVGLLALTGIAPGSSYGAVWWRLSLVGVGFGLSFSPLSAAALASVDPHRAGLASSVANTTRQVGTVLGIALLGSLVTTRAVAAVNHALVGVASPAADRLAQLLGHGGALSPLPRVLPAGYDAARLHAISAAGFVTGIHLAFRIDAAVLLAASACAAVLLRPGRAPARRAARGGPVRAPSGSAEALVGSAPLAS